MGFQENIRIKQDLIIEQRWQRMQKKTTYLDLQDLFKQY